MDATYPVTTDCGVDNHAGLFYQKIQSGSNFSDGPGEHSYDMTLVSTSNPEIKFRSVNGGPELRSGTWVSCFGGVSMEPESDPSLDANDQIRLIDRLRQRVIQHDFNAAIAIGESHKSFDMIGKRATQLAHLVRGLRHGDVSAIKKALNWTSANTHLSPRFRKRLERVGAMPHGNRRLKKTNSLFLELEYGWRPLMYDLYEGAIAVSKALEGPKFFAFRAGIKKYTPIQNSMCDSGHVFTKKQIRMVMSQPETASIDDYGLRDPASLVWELLPYSFVVDWAIPIGKYLQARNFVGNINTLSCWSTVVTTQRGFRSTAAGHIVQGPPCSYLAVTMQRRPETLYVPLPKIKVLTEIISPRRAIDGLALLYALKK